MKRYQDLEVLIEQFEHHPLGLQVTDPILNKWEASIKDLDPQFMFYIDSYALANKGKCKDIRIDVNADLTKHKDVITLFNNSNYKPSFEYRETFCTLTDNALELYTDGSFDFTKVFL